MLDIIDVPCSLLLSCDDLKFYSRPVCLFGNVLMIAEPIFLISLILGGRAMIFNPALSACRRMYIKPMHGAQVLIGESSSRVIVFGIASGDCPGGD